MSSTPGPLTTAQIVTLIRYFRNDIAAFARFMFGSELRPKQIEIADAFRLNQRISVRGGVGFGKTHVVVILIFWGMICFDEIQISLFAPTEGQIDSGLWKELKVLFNKMPAEFRDMLELNQTRLVRKNTPTALAEKKIANKDNPEAARGTHMPRNWVIVDEASGVDDRIFEVLENIFSDPDPKLCLISNPTKASGHFFRTHEDPDIREDYVRIHGAATDNPTLTPERLETMIRQRGGPLSQNTRINIYGEFPLSDADGVIPADLVMEAANATDVTPAYGAPIIWGLDCAGKGGDRSVLVARQENVVLECHEWRGLDTVQLSHRVKALFDKAPKASKPAAICIDALGLGEGVYDQLSNMDDVPAKRIAVSNKATRKPDTFYQLRDELWWTAREWFEEGAKSIPNHPDLVKELCLPSYDYRNNGKLKVEDKKAIRKRGRVSPDYADAFCLTFAANGARSTGKYAWNKPLPSTDMRAFY